MTFTVRFANPDDAPAIRSVIAELMPELDHARRHQWLYEDNPHGRALTWIAVEDDTKEVAGCTSFFRRTLIVDGKEVGGALGGDGFVRPRFRRRGLGAAMHRASRAGMSEHGIAVMFGTPMPANLTPLTQAGARSITETVQYARPILPGALGGALDRLIAPARLDPMVEDDPRVDAVWSETAPELGIATVRDARFYTWRFLRSPSQAQHPFVIVDGERPIAACALERLGNGLRIVDLIAPRARWGQALRAIAARVRDCRTLQMKLTREDYQARRLWLQGFVPRESKKDLNLLLPEHSPDEATFYDPARWYFTWAESDLDTFA